MENIIWKTKAEFHVSVVKELKKGVKILYYSTLETEYKLTASNRMLLSP